MNCVVFQDAISPSIGTQLMAEYMTTVAGHMPIRHGQRVSTGMWCGMCSVIN